MSSLVFIFSMLHLGFDSFFTIPAVFSLTLAYHITILTMEYRNSTRLESAPSTALSAIVCGATLTALWLGCFTVVLLVAVLFGARAILEEKLALWMLVIQCFLAFVEAMIMLSIVVRTAYERQKPEEGSRKWRRMEETD